LAPNQADRFKNREVFMGKKLTDEQIAQRKQMREACDELYRRLSAFFSGRPPNQ
jgi:uncharacterized membrane-anchored protein